MTTRAAAHADLSLQVGRQLVSLAIRAPSVHNTQPWAWRIRPGGIELYADVTRRLDASDPVERNLVISCGAALHHLRVAARASGLHPEVSRMPDPTDPYLLAQVSFTPAPAPRTAAADLRAIRERCTDRRRFTSWPVPNERLRLLARVVEERDFSPITCQLARSFRTDCPAGSTKGFSRILARNWRAATVSSCCAAATTPERPGCEPVSRSVHGGSAPCRTVSPWCR
jgi:hypothetical protein